MKKIFISAGDPSGDIHASRLMQSILSIQPDIKFIGLGGPKMQKLGLEPLADFDKISVVGFWEVARKYGFFRELINRIVYLLKNEDISAFVPVDYPGMNMRLAKQAREIGIPVIYYIAPQLWAWGKDRAKKLAHSVDKLLVVFPFEEEYFSEFGIDTSFVGHPAMDDDELKYENTGIRDKLIAFLPGSREQEVNRHLPIFNRTIDILASELNDYRFGISIMDKKNFKTNQKADIFSNSRELMKKSAIGVVKTGTSNLEAVLCGMPFVMVYKTSTVSFELGKRLVNLPYVSLANILANKHFVPELIQKDATPRKIAVALINYIENDDLYSDTLTEFTKIREILGEQGASAKAASIICNYI